MLWYIIFGIIILLILLIIYVYYTTKDKLKEAFEVIDNMDISNLDISNVGLNTIVQQIATLNVTDLSGVINTSGNINAQQLATQLQQSFNIDVSTADNRPITDIGKQCDTYAKQLSNNQVVLEQYNSIGDWKNVRSTKKMIEGLQDTMSKLSC
jgi:hypothetical protein